MYTDPQVWIPPLVLTIFILAYGFVFLEEKLQLRKSKPVMIAAGAIWIFVAILYQAQNRSAEVSVVLRQVVLEYAELFLFLLSAMSFVNAMVERNLFETLKAKLVGSKLSVRELYWITGTCAFVLSPIADNLTTALVMGTVVLSTLGTNKRVLTAALVSVVVAANAGGAFSPFGDITTLMVWQKGKIEFTQFFDLFIPSLVNWLIPAVIMSLTLPSQTVNAPKENTKVLKGGFVIAGLFLSTVVGTIVLDHFLHLPPFLGMMMGLGLLNLYSYFLHRAEIRSLLDVPAEAIKTQEVPFSIFHILEKTEWDTLLFFYGIMLCVGGLGAVGFLGVASHALYAQLGPTSTNIIIGLLSAVIDNIPLTFAVLTMNPEMHLGQWLLITLAAGVGGSLLSIGSAAGIALMGIGKRSYTFVSHLKWSWAILLGYAGSICAHFLLNRSLF
jgi:Na+/H+ antiporter NhaD/arsenite permease-like protein